MISFYLRLGVFAMLLFAASATVAQPQCGFDDILQEQLRVDPAFSQRLADFETFRQQRGELMRLNPERRMDAQNQVFEIPVVFHIIHTGSAVGTQFNPSVTRINQVVNYLNDTYAATWMNYPGEENGGVSMPIRFVLAKRDPGCNPTNGITRFNVSDVLPADSAQKYIEHGVKRKTRGISDSLLKSIVQWDNRTYYNIWVVNKIDGWSGYVSGSGVVGYAYFPGVRAALVGTVIMEAFNRSGSSTLPHELGHAFNLYHTFEGGCTTGDCDTTGDYVCDTEPHTQEDIDCSTGNNPCSSTAWGPVKHNMMNYTPCPDRFTVGQRDRVLAALLHGRSSLINSLGGVAPGSPPATQIPIPATCGPITIQSPNNTYGMGAERIRIGGLEHFTSNYYGDGFQQYIDYTKESCSQRAVPPAEMEIGKTYPVEISTSTNPQNVRVWIDFNNDGTFSANEMVFTSDGKSGEPDVIHSGNTIAIPPTVEKNVPLRMRVYADYYSRPKPTTCVVSVGYGQIEDFSVIVRSALPVTLTSFTARVSEQSQQVHLDWSTASESSPATYEIHRSTNGQHFDKLDQLPAMTKAEKYTYIDKQPVIGARSFYKLRIIDIDGAITYSKVVSATVLDVKQLAFKVFPNPASKHLLVTGNRSGSYDISVINMFGQVVMAKKSVRFEKYTPVPFNVETLKSGLYQIQLRDEQGIVVGRKFIKD